MEARELKDMTAVLRSINDGNPSNAERWVNLTQRVIRAEYRANTAERAAARKDWERQNAEDDAWIDRKSTRLNSSHYQQSRMPSSA